MTVFELLGGIGWLVEWGRENPTEFYRHIDEAFPVAMRKRTNAQNMMIKFINSSVWQLAGSDSCDSLAGSPPVGIIASEWALAAPRAWAYLQPILRENGGRALFISTPRGRNSFHRMFDESKSDPE